MPKSISIIGAGRLGRALGKLLSAQGWTVGAVITRHEASARKAVRFIGAGRPYAAMKRQVLASRLILIATPDDAVPRVAQELARVAAEELRGKVVLHTAGALDSTALYALRLFGAALGSIHPMQCFSGVGVPSLDGMMFAVEGDAQAVRVARRVTRALGGSLVRVSAAKKPLYHAAGVLAAGHVLALMEAATQTLIAAGMKRREALRALLPLTQQVLNNFERLGPTAAWTGPLARGDYRVLAAHTKALQHLPPEFSEAYQALNHLAARVLARNPESMLQAIG
jgi:predicted short-subunit dehydrogenase-like oxidoreductase (DUF2520 family)